MHGLDNTHRNNLVQTPDKEPVLEQELHTFLQPQCFPPLKRNTTKAVYLGRLREKFLFV